MADPVLAVAGLTKRFGALSACDGVMLDLRLGEIHALIGPNGAGKSTLNALIGGALRPDAGRIRLGTRDITQLGPAARARLGLARSFQISELALEMTVLQNVALAVLGRQGGAFGMVWRIMRDPRITDPARICVATLGLGPREAVPAGALSHGERRRLEMAMALALRPRAFLLDEPMAGLGAEGAADLVTVLRGLKTAAPILLVEHDMDAVFALSDRITVMVGGRIVATGDPGAIRADPAVRAAYLGTGG